MQSYALAARIATLSDQALADTIAGVRARIHAGAPDRRELVRVHSVLVMERINREARS